ERIEAERRLHLCNCFIQTSECSEKDKCIPVMRYWIIRLQFKSPVEFAFGRDPVPVVVGETISKRSMSFSQRVIDLERPLESLARLRIGVLWRQRCNSKTADNEI